ncbi:hypothetical protein [Piscirickettsia salmonis]|uniref:hypothetical protein n=1 Tax=Piscirickettsia salmonis TaxID=1238 RepID=UPI000AC5F9FF|nr:hypothetical protein [Piscirickettsia salmonis]QNR80143.1 hypothetical protein ICC15_14605 [Piscirickettsia salmonis]WGZ72805.1 hypothetical protein E3220_15290 [Piscirickettsia salmonis EM-90]
MSRKRRYLGRYFDHWMCKIPTEVATLTEDFQKGSKIIHIACEKDLYTKVMDDNQEFKSMLGDHIKVYPELFPAEFHNDYSLYGKGRCSKKLDNLQFKRIKIKTTGEIFCNSKELK